MTDREVNGVDAHGEGQPPIWLHRDGTGDPRRRVAVAWRELRRLAASKPVRQQLYGFEPPLDQGQGDALEYVVGHGPCRMGELARFMRLEPSSVTRAVERLETAGLVVRNADPDDARVVQVSCTEAGLALYTEVRSRAGLLLGDALAGFTPEESDALAGLMERLAASVESLVAKVV